MRRALRGCFFVVAIFGWLTGIPIRGQTNQLTGRYSGTVHNSTEQFSAGVEIGVNQEVGTIYGCMGVNLPLFGSGPLHGKTEGRDVSFDVVSPTMTIQFHGQRDGDSIAGTYIVSPSEGGMKQRGEFSLRRDTLESLPIGFNLEDCPDDTEVHREGTLFVEKLGRTIATRPSPSQPPSAPQVGGPSVSRGTQLEPRKPLTRDQVQSLVGAGLGDESGAKLIGERGIDFAPVEDFFQNLKTAGANEAFLKALRAAAPPEPASAKKPLNQLQLITLLAAQVPSHRVAMLVNERGIDFNVKDDYLREVHLSGGDDELINALKNAEVRKLMTVDPAAEARLAGLQQHVARGAELYQKRQYAQAEQEIRAALLLDSQNADLYLSLANILVKQDKLDDAVSAGREALRLNPNSEAGHFNLGVALEAKGDWDGGIVEEREALRLNPDNDLAHYTLGFALQNKGDWDGAIAEYREAIRLNPKNDSPHIDLGGALRWKGDWDGAMAEFREALRLNPNNDMAHAGLGLALGNKGDWDGEIAEEREAIRLNANNFGAHVSLGLALGSKGDWDGEIAEEREAIRLNPNYDAAHVNLGSALSWKGDWDGEITEEREALRLNPNNASAHNNLGRGLEKKGDLRGALEEYRAAYMLNPKEARYKQDYERLLQQVNK